MSKTDEILCLSVVFFPSLYVLACAVVSIIS